MLKFICKMRGAASITFLSVLFVMACSGGSDSEGSDSPDGGPLNMTDAAPPIDQPPLTEGLATLAGTSIPGAQDGDRENAYLDNPVNVEFADGHIFIADFYNGSIRRSTPQGTVETVSTQPASGQFVRPFGMTALGSYLYIGTDAKSDGLEGGAIWRMPLAGGAPELLLDGVGRPRGLATLEDGRLVVADYQAHTVSIFDPDDNSLSLLAGSGQAGYAEGQGATASFDVPYDVAIYLGNILVSDFGNQRIRQIDLAGNVSTFAGTGLPGNDNGARETATFNFPQGLAVDSSDRIFITDTGNYLVRLIASDVVSTVAGDGSAGYQDSEVPTEGKLFGLEGITVSGEYSYIADGNRGLDGPYHRVRRLSLP